MIQSVMVSVVCATYNQEKYIKNAIEGFLNQKTDFKYEIIIHDDASTDNTAAIIRKYEKQYPDIIKPIYSKKNKYSINPYLVSEAMYEKAVGKYVAICEGDDYWTNPLKLQKQVEALEANQDIDICAHAAYIFQNGEKIDEIRPRHQTCIIPVEEVIKGHGGFVATNSLLIKATLLKNLPEFIKDNPIDYFHQILGALHGGMFFIDEYMSVYNYMNTGSWTDRRSDDACFSVDVNKKLIYSYGELKKFTEHKYDAVIDKMILENKKDILWYEGKLKEMLTRKECRSVMSARDYIKVCLRLLFPSLYEYLWRRRYKR